MKPAKIQYPVTVKFRKEQLVIEAKDVRRFMDQIRRERPVMFERHNNFVQLDLFADDEI